MWIVDTETLILIVYSTYGNSISCIHYRFFYICIMLHTYWNNVYICRDTQYWDVCLRLEVVLPGKYYVAYIIIFMLNVCISHVFMSAVPQPRDYTVRLYRTCIYTFLYHNAIYRLDIPYVQVFKRLHVSLSLFVVQPVSEFLQRCVCGCKSQSMKLN